MIWKNEISNSIVLIQIFYSRFYWFSDLKWLKYEGEALIAYVILMTVVGLPLFVMELALGQLAGSGIVKLWRAVPLLKGTTAAVSITIYN